MEILLSTIMYCFFIFAELIGSLIVLVPGLLCVSLVKLIFTGEFPSGLNVTEGNVMELTNKIV